MEFSERPQESPNLLTENRQGRCHKRHRAAGTGGRRVRRGDVGPGDGDRVWGQPASGQHLAPWHRRTDQGGKTRPTPPRDVSHGGCPTSAHSTAPVFCSVTPPATVASRMRGCRLPTQGPPQKPAMQLSHVTCRERVTVPAQEASEPEH